MDNEEAQQGNTTSGQTAAETTTTSETTAPEQQTPTATAAEEAPAPEAGQEEQVAPAETVTPAEEPAPAQEAAPEVAPAPAETPAPVAADTTATPELIEDTVTASNSSAQADSTPTTPEPAPVDVAVADEAGDLNVSKLETLLAVFKDQIGKPGKTPEDFREAAKTALMITKHVIAKPKPEVFDALLAFFVAEKNGVCSPSEFLKGSTTLAKFDEQKVGYLFNLFSDLSHKRGIPLNAAQAASVLGGQEIVGYYNRKRAGFKAR